MKLLNLALATLVIATQTMIGAPVMAQETVEYRTRTTTYEGTLFRPDADGSLNGIGVLIAHDFFGPGENQFLMARELANDGATVFVADFYGKGVRPDGPEAATAEAIKVRGAVAELRAARTAAWSELTAVGFAVDRTAGIGTCGGGLAALELGRTGVDVGAIAVLWGILENTEAATGVPLLAPVTLFHGDIDPLAPLSALDSLTAELDADASRYEVHLFEGVAHAFTLPFVGTNTSSGFAYDEAATNASLQALHTLLQSL